MMGLLLRILFRSPQAGHCRSRMSDHSSMLHQNGKYFKLILWKPLIIFSLRSSESAKSLGAANTTSFEQVTSAIVQRLPEILIALSQRRMNEYTLT